MVIYLPKVAKKYLAIVQFEIKKSMTVSDNTIQAEGLGSFFKILGRSSAEAGKQLATNLLKFRDRALEFTSDIAVAAATRNPKNVLSTLPEVRKYYHTGKGLNLGKFVWFML